MKEYNQEIIKFDYEKNFEDRDFYVSKSNEHIMTLLNNWPKWEKNFLNISGEKFSGKTHLINIFLNKFNGIKLDSSSLKNKHLKEIKIYQNIVIENLTKEIDENLIFTLINIIDQDNKYLIVTSEEPIVNIDFNLNDLKSRAKSFLLQSIYKPDDDLIFALILKNLSDRQISLDKKLINYLIKRIDRSYSKIFDFIYKVDEISLKKKKSIDLNIIKEVLGEWLNKYRSHNCSELRKKDVNNKAILSGWINKKRDHGNLLFIDLRDNYGITQCIIDKENANFSELEKIQLETVIKVEGKVINRSKETINKDIETGEVEVVIDNYEILGSCKELPMPVFSDQEYSEEIRLKYRFIDLRRKKIHENIILRSKVISFIRGEMNKLGFLEFQTPILTSSSPEGARDFLVPSRLNPGKFYALPQAPQQFKQLIMVSGFDKYFQIAPCFRDEDARSDRSPGEFYQLDLEMSFVEQEDIFRVVEKLLINTFQKFSNKKLMFNEFPKIPYAESLLKYGTDKPDLRNPLIINDITEIFSREDVTFEIFKKLVKSGSRVRCIITKNTKDKPRSFFDNIDRWAKEQGASGLAYFTFEKEKKISAKGPIGKFFSSEALEEIMKKTNAEIGDSIFFACAKERELEQITSIARNRIAKDLDLINEDSFAFCWIVDYPMFQKNEQTKKIEFSHNPFSMPQGTLSKIDFTKPLEILAYQYDIVCNGIELSSGAIRNHKPELMYKLFSIAGYEKKHVDEKFAGMINALSYGAPPHGGIAPGIDRIVMLLAEEKNIREVTMFPMNQNAQDLMMQAPSQVDNKLLKELGIKLDIKKS